MRQTDETLAEVNRKLSLLPNLVAYQVVEGKTLSETVQVLTQLGSKTSEIARLFGAASKSVSIRRAEATKKQRIGKGN
jgi:hypothetical protein